MSKVSEHRYLGAGITAEIAQGTFVIVRGHRDPDAIPGPTAFSFVIHDSGVCVPEIKIYNGRRMRLSEHRLVNSFAGSLGYVEMIGERWRGGELHHVLQIRGKSESDPSTE